ncbi:unnamed protein product, partial [marine sediment metagenome]
MGKSNRGFSWIFTASAVCLVIGVTVALMLPAMQSAREAARSAPGRDYESLQSPEATPRVSSLRSTGRVTRDTPDTSAADSPESLPNIARPMEEPSIIAPEEPTIPPPMDPQRPGEGVGPGQGGDRYGHLVDNPFHTVADHPLSTFSIDVDTASYANVRRYLLSQWESHRLPPADAVRIEEMVNYFDYEYAGPEDDVPFAAHIDVAGCPWATDHRLVRVALKGKEVAREERPASNLVFLVDVSGSMKYPDKLDLVKYALKTLAEEMRPIDRVAIVVYSGAEGLALESTPGSRSRDIINVLDNLEAGGSTNGGAGIELAYKVAKENFISDGVNRVVLCTDGDFNVGRTSQGGLTRMAEEKAKSGVFLSVLGFGRGNLNDAMMESISNKGNGNYAYIDGETEARKVLVREMGGTLVTI